MAGKAAYVRVSLVTEAGHGQPQYKATGKLPIDRPLRSVCLCFFLYERCRTGDLSFWYVGGRRRWCSTRSRRPRGCCESRSCRRSACVWLDFVVLDATSVYLG